MADYAGYSYAPPPAYAADPHAPHYGHAPPPAAGSAELEALKRENEAIKAENASLRAENASLRSQAAGAPAPAPALVPPPPNFYPPPAYPSNYGYGAPPSYPPAGPYGYPPYGGAPPPSGYGGAPEPRAYKPPLEINKGNRRGPKGANLALFCIPNSYTDHEVYDLAKAYGQCIFASVATHRETGASRGYAFVSYETIEEANVAIAGLHNMSVEGRAMRCEVARSDRDGGGAGAKPY